MDENPNIYKLYTKEKPTFKNDVGILFPSRLFLPINKDRKGEGGLRTKGLFRNSFKNKPLISVVTIVYNGETYLEQTILSVLNQTYDNIEYIIIDGGSTDATLEIIKKYEDKIDYWVSEKDRGIYDAFNKGINLTSGLYVGLLNADDYYDLNTIKTFIQEYNSFPQGDIFYGDMYLFNEKYDRKKRMNALSLDNLDRDICVNHPTCFVRKEIYHNIQFDLHYALSADYDFIIRLYKKNYIFRHIHKILTNMRDGGVSTQFDKAEKETLEIRTKHYGLIKAYRAFAIKSIRKLIKSIVLPVVSERKWIEKRYSD
jgi:glycosyltransferase involved in cell wall biosynthesis